MQALHEWALMEPEQLLCNRARMRKQKQRATASQESRAKERERNNVIQGESSGIHAALSGECYTQFFLQIDRQLFSAHTVDWEIFTLKTTRVKILR